MSLLSQRLGGRSSESREREEAPELGVGQWGSKTALPGRNCKSDRDVSGGPVFQAVPPTARKCEFNPWSEN